MRQLLLASCICWPTNRIMRSRSFAERWLWTRKPALLSWAWRPSRSPANAWTRRSRRCGKCVRRDPALSVAALGEDDDAYVTDVDDPDAWAAAEARATSDRR